MASCAFAWKRDFSSFTDSEAPAESAICACEKTRQGTKAIKKEATIDVLKKRKVIQKKKKKTTVVV